MATKHKLKKQDKNIIIFVVLGFVILTIAGFAIVGGAVGHLMGDLNDNLNNPPDAEKIWNDGDYHDQTILIQKYYDTKIVDRKTDTDKKTDSIKLSTNQGWDFWFFCKKASNFGHDCYYRSADSEEDRSFGEILYEMSRDEITRLANAYGGQKIEGNTYEFETEDDKKAFAEDVARLDVVKPSVEICKELRKQDSFYCRSVTPVKISNGSKSAIDIYSLI